MGPYNRKVYPMSTSASTTPSSTRARKRTAITQDDLDLAIEALKLYASSDGLTPVRYCKGAKLTPAAILRAELGLSMKRSDTTMQKLRRTGAVIPTEKSRKVIIKEMMPNIDASDETPQPSVVTVERIRAAIAKLRQENAELRQENESLHRRIGELESRVVSLEQLQALENLIDEIEAA